LGGAAAPPREESGSAGASPYHRSHGSSNEHMLTDVICVRRQRPEPRRDLVAFAEAFLGFVEHHGVGFAKDAGDAGGEGAFGEGGGEFAVVDVGGVDAGKPVLGLAKEVVAHFPPLDEVEGLGVGPEADDFADVDLAGDIDVMGQPFVPMVAPIRAEGPGHLGAEAIFDGRDGGGNIVVMLKGANVFVEIGRFGRAAAQGVDFGAGEAIEVVKDHGGQGRA